MNIDAQTEAILNLLLGEGKEFSRMDPVFQAKLLHVLEILLRVRQMTDLYDFKSLNVKFFDGHYQVYVTSEKRLWFELHDGGILIIHIGSTKH